MRGLALALSFLLVVAAQGDMKAKDGPFERWDPNIGTDPAVITLYFSLSDLATQDQREQMWALPDATKAALWTYNIKRYLRDHPELSAEAQETLRVGLGLAATPGWFDIAPGSFGYEPQVKALVGFKRLAISSLSRETIFDVFIRLGSDPMSFRAIPAERAGPPATVRGFTPQTDVQNVCHCATGFDCGSSSSFDCYDSWCEPSRHCGWFNLEMCIGACKSN